MSTVIAQFVTITCDSPECQHTVTFAQNEAAQAEAVHDNPWMSTLRFINVPDNRKFGYCSDTCEAEGIKTGQHNPIEQKKIDPSVATPAQIQLAALAADNARKATEALKTGQGTVKLS
jgi:hypothetical protein